MWRRRKRPAKTKKPCRRWHGSGLQMTFYVLLGCGNAVEKTVTIAVIHGYHGGMQDVNSYALVADCAHRVTTLLSLDTNGSSSYSLAPSGAPCLMPLLRGYTDSHS